MTFRVHVPKHNPPHYAETFFAEVDQNFGITSYCPLIRLPKIQEDEWLVVFHEDARLVVFKDKLYASYVSDVSYQDDSYHYQSCMQVGSFSPGYQIVTSFRPNIANNNAKNCLQNNWLFFEKDQRLLIMTILDPMVVYDATDSLENPRKITEQPKVIKNWHFGHIKASTNPIFINELERYLSFFHSNLLTTDGIRQHFLGALLFDRNFNITEYSKIPLFMSTPHTPRHMTANTIMPHGCIRENDNLLLSVGINDKISGIMKLPLKNILATLSPSPPQSLKSEVVSLSGKTTEDITDKILEDFCRVNFTPSIRVHNIDIKFHPSESSRLSHAESDFLKCITPAEQVSSYGGKLKLIDTSVFLGTAAHNPSLIEYAGNRYMTFRVHFPKHNPPYYAETFFAKVDQNFGITSYCPLIQLPKIPEDQWPVVFHEDARLMVFKNKLYASYVSDVSYQDDSYHYQSCMKIGSFSPGQQIITSSRPCIDNNNTKNSLQKNWAFFEKDQRLMIITMLDPMVVFDATDSLKNPRKLIEKSLVIRDWLFGRIRASTNPIFINECKRYLTFFHSHLVTTDGIRQYFLGLLLFDNEFNITDYSKTPLFVSTPHLERHMAANTILPYGCIREKDNLLLSIGINDKISAVMELPLKKVLETLSPHPCEKEKKDMTDRTAEDPSSVNLETPTFASLESNFVSPPAPILSPSSLNSQIAVTFIVSGIDFNSRKYLTQPGEGLLIRYGRPKPWRRISIDPFFDENAPTCSVILSNRKSMCFSLSNGNQRDETVIEWSWSGSVMLTPEIYAWQLWKTHGYGTAIAKDQIDDCDGWLAQGKIDLTQDNIQTLTYQIQPGEGSE
ncbi:hypothetical protein [Candidatus Finniella inopinata]|uniref:Uncharacterized protein n=1 Tax=Candidatus Finniella inopinata TaxID=1696036 RepID=A0A4Q7DIK8_9PROT|nr:hypothetical protein [Candidatus Finniella inopinata]RZI46049.1 hypothetical protein EQU50_03710 [Candidatus Finniella inopinata]